MDGSTEEKAQMKDRIYGLTKQGFVKRQTDGPAGGGRIGERLMHGRVDRLTDGKRWLIRGKEGRNEREKDG
jgi:hypothetical protein